jgi:hypothetical protein
MTGPLERADPMLRVAESHVENRAVVIPEFKLLYVPVPKTGWTAMLWMLLPLTGLTAEDFLGSTKPEISASMAVHDERVWGRRGRRWRDLDPDARAVALEAPDWFRFTVVRNPAQRLWSAWQSKLLLREPVYFGFHKDQPWYPHVPHDPAEILGDFRAFVAALGVGFDDDTKMRDPHWGLQSDVTTLLPLNHVGHLERLEETEQALRRHVAGLGGPELRVTRENVMSLPYQPSVYDEVSAVTVRRIYAKDYQQFGYDALVLPQHGLDDGGTDPWSMNVRQQIPHLRELVARHERLYAVVTEFRAQLRSSSADNDRLEERLRLITAERGEARQQLLEVHRALDAGELVKGRTCFNHTMTESSTSMQRAAKRRLRRSLVALSDTTPGSEVVKRLVPLDRRLAVTSRGRFTLLGPVRGPLLVLTTVDAKTGLSRTAPVRFRRDGDRLLVTAKKSVQGTFPAWSRDLIATPEATVTVGGAEVRVFAERRPAKSGTGGTRRFVLTASETASTPPPAGRGPDVFAPSLTSLAKRFKTDKWGAHRYTTRYDTHFAPWRYQDLTLLEIGIGGYARDGAGGNSLRMWKAYFPRAQIFGLDIEDKSFVDEPRIRTFKGDQTDPEVLAKIARAAGGLTLIIDDGSHRPAHIIETFRTLFPLLADDGIYVIEDTQTSYWPEFDGAESLDAPGTTMAMVKALIDGLNYEEFVIDGYQPSYTDLHVTQVSCYHNLVFIQKGDNREGTRKEKILSQRYSTKDPAG